MGSSQESIPTVTILSLVYIICIQTLRSVTEPLFGFGLVPLTPSPIFAAHSLFFHTWPQFGITVVFLSLL